MKIQIKAKKTIWINDKDKELYNRLNKFGEALNTGKNLYDESIMLKKITEKSETANHHIEAFLSEKDQELFYKLKEISSKIAEEKALPSYLIFTNKSLIEMVEKKPRSREDLIKISGVGEMKFEAYGKALIEVIEEFCREKEK